MATKTITSANSQLVFSIPDLGLTAAIQGYAADAAFMNEPLKPVETTRGVDGTLSLGFVFSDIKQKITLSPDSPSKAIFDAWFNLMVATREVVIANATLFLPATNESYTFTKGGLTTYHGAPSGKKILQPVEYEITWESISQAVS